MTELVTKELTPETWQDFEWFFSQGNGWDHCGCTAYQGLRAPRDLRSWSEKRDWNLAAKCSLVDEGLAHGILVYADETPVGWCQFGPGAELPLQHDVESGPPSLASSDTPWRITCFCTAKDWRGQRVAELALRSALSAIQKSGGGIVDACPIPVMPNDDELDALISRTADDRARSANICSQRRLRHRSRTTTGGRSPWRASWSMASVR